MKAFSVILALSCLLASCQQAPLAPILAPGGSSATTSTSGSQIASQQAQESGEDSGGAGPSEPSAPETPAAPPEAVPRRSGGGRSADTSDRPITVAEAGPRPTAEPLHDSEWIETHPDYVFRFIYGSEPLTTRAMEIPPSGIVDIRGRAEWSERSAPGIREHGDHWYPTLDGDILRFVWTPADGDESRALTCDVVIDRSGGHFLDSIYPIVSPVTGASLAVSPGDLRLFVMVKKLGERYGITDPVTPARPCSEGLRPFSQPMIDDARTMIVGSFHLGPLEDISISRDVHPSDWRNPSPLRNPPRVRIR